MVTAMVLAVFIHLLMGELKDPLNDFVRQLLPNGYGVGLGMGGLQIGILGPYHSTYYFLTSKSYLICPVSLATSL